MRSRPSVPTSRRFATWANVRCGIGMTILLEPAGRLAAASGARPAPSFDAGVSEGADQPFWAEIRENQASSGRLASSVVMSEEGYYGPHASSGTHPAGSGRTTRPTGSRGGRVWAERPSLHHAG